MTINSKARLSPESRVLGLGILAGKVKHISIFRIFEKIKLRNFISIISRSYSAKRNPSKQKEIGGQPTETKRGLLRVRIKNFLTNLKSLTQKNTPKAKAVMVRALFANAFRALGRTEKAIVFFLLAIIFISGTILSYNFWVRHTVVAPAKGGVLTEGVIGNPRYINPILAQTNEADLDLVKLVFSSLFAFNSAGELVSDAAESYTLSDDKKTYTIKIKNNIRWHDGKPLTAEDVLFTVKAIQNPAYKSPLRANLSGIEVEKTGDYELRFSLKSPYEPFLQNLTFGILPAHIWQAISAENTPLAQYNTKPVGSGPYEFDSIEKDKSGKIISLRLTANNKYYNRPPFIEKIVFKFFNNEESLADALEKNQVDSTSYLSTKGASQLKRADLRSYAFKTPRYFAVFLNPEESKILADKNIRIALNYLTDKNKLVDEFLKGNGQKVETPIPPALKESSFQTKIYNFDQPYANTILANSGWKADSDSWLIKEIKEKIRDRKTGKTSEVVKEKIPLEFTLTTGDSPEFKKLAEVLQNQWQKGGIKVNLNFLNPAEIQSAIKERDYEALLFGEIINLNPDPYIFWHSSSIKDPGLNLAVYSNKNVDKELEDLRQTFDQDKKNALLAKFQADVVDDAPAIFLFSPYLNYSAANNLKGVEEKIVTLSADRFNDISNWYLETKRVWKK